MISSKARGDCHRLRVQGDDDQSTSFALSMNKEAYGSLHAMREGRCDCSVGSGARVAIP